MCLVFRSVLGFQQHYHRRYYFISLPFFKVHLLVFYFFNGAALSFFSRWEDRLAFFSLSSKCCSKVDSTKLWYYFKGFCRTESDLTISGYVPGSSLRLSFSDSPFTLSTTICKNLIIYEFLAMISWTIRLEAFSAFI